VSLTPRRARQVVVFWMMFIVQTVVGWMFLPGDIGANELSLSMIIVPMMVSGIIAWITGEAIEKVQRMKHLQKDDD